MIPKVYIIHENNEWIGVFEKVFTENNLPFENYYLTQGNTDLSSLPPQGVFFSRMSASSYTRGNRFSPEYTAVVLDWLETHGRRVINGTAALKLEISKIAQYMRLQTYGITIPKTVAAFGRQDILKAAQNFSAPFIIKPNRGGKGIGVQLFQSYKILEDFINSDAFEPSVDNITLVQEYIQAPEPFITRLEFVGGKFIYALRVNTSNGFQLCPADACRIDAPKNAEELSLTDTNKDMFYILDNFDNPIIVRLEAFLKDNKIELAGIEFVYDKNGNMYVYDVNTNTNYNPDAEKKAGIYAIKLLSDFLSNELKKIDTTHTYKGINNV